jgi:hypothetical protein
LTACKPSSPDIPIPTSAAFPSQSKPSKLHPEKKGTHLDHANVIRSISNGQSHGSVTVLDKPDDERFLEWRYTAAYHAFTQCRKPKQQFFVVFAFKGLRGMWHY